MAIPTPVDDDYDYLPADGPQIAVGDDILGIALASGTVLSITPPPGFWQYLLQTANPSGTEYQVAFFPEDPGSQLPEWWARVTLWKRAAKLADGGALTASDGSKWRYAVGEDGKMVCYAPGSTFARGERRFRGHLLTDGLWIGDDPDYDWLPVEDGADVDEGDVLLCSLPRAGVVDDIVIGDESPYFIRTEFKDASSQSLGWFDQPGEEALPASVGFTWVFFERKPKPADETLFTATDGSRWIYADGVYFCWGGGSIYPSGALFQWIDSEILSPVSPPEFV